MILYNHTVKLFDSLQCFNYFRQEQERKKQQEFERQLEKQREIERQRDEQRQKMMDQREVFTSFIMIIHK